ncbi:Hint domain-containing protein [Acetobacter senegalensis]|uniref:Hint domain-containing protein n=1 Tax=Acetobacter senegalensis TaxID=446692 RepID=UPI001EDB2636|nr:Hint domain-containing protein [Acetobacter senegalensis]MCG4273024.1 Hint domain-containing protein [Acetobacter senegalensis]
MAINLLFDQTIDYSVDQPLNLTVGGNILITRDATTPAGDNVVVQLSDLANIQALDTVVIENGATGVVGAGLASVKAISNVIVDGGTLDLGGSLAAVNVLTSIGVGPEGGNIKVENSGLGVGVLKTKVQFVNSAGKTTTTVPENFTVDFPGVTSVAAVYNAITDTTTVGLDLSILGLIDVSLGPSIQVAGNPFNISGGWPYSLKWFDSTNNPDGTGGVLICFLSNSMIRTPEGDVPVQDIQVGDSVVAYVDGQQQVRKVVWAGKARVAVKAGLSDDEAGYPVRILKDALAEGVPYKDMLVTPEHCLFFNGLFTPVRMLVNGASIFYDHSITSYDYYHIETEQHSVIVADGVMTESYLDTGNRGSFRQEGTVVSLNAGSHKTARTWAEDAAAPLVVAQAVVEPIFRKIEARAKHAGIEAVTPARVVTNDADVHLVTENGAIIRKAREQNGKVFFMLPPGIDRVWLVSRTSRPVDTIGPFVDDRRQLGVLVSNMSLQEGVGAARNLENIMQDANLQGWHGVDAGHSMRWTAGHAEIPLVERTPGALAMLSVQIIAAGPYVLEGEQTEQKVASL